MVVGRNRFRLGLESYFMSKVDRTKAAQIAEAQRVGKRAVSLAVALLRAKALRDCVEEPLRRQAESARSLEELRTEAVDNALKVVSTDASRVDSLYSLYLGALYAVVEKWGQWGFRNSTVDLLLSDNGRKATLEGHRHAVFHADHYDDPRIAALVDRSDMIGWADELSLALERFLRSWHNEPEENIRAHLEASRSTATPLNGA